ncbi:glucose-6-phosphate isomerase [Planctomycetia bacterium]|nr:glucose-6-phosphate isomerase [Planctomycetia bacterium]
MFRCPLPRKSLKALPMTDSVISYHPDAALRLLRPGRLAGLQDALEAARDATLNDVELWQSGESVPPERQPLDAGFIQWPEELLADLQANRGESLIARLETTGSRLRQLADSLVVLGIGGSYMGMRAMFEALRPACWNELSRSERDSAPRLYFDGWNVDSDRQHELLSLLERRAVAGPDAAAGRTAIISISKSGGTLEPAVAFRAFRDFVERRFPGMDRDLIVPVTGESGRLRSLAEAAGYRDVYSIPDGIGGRFSVLTAVGLLPAVTAGLNIRALLQGAAALTDHFRRAPFEQNVVLQFVAVCHAFEADHGMNCRVLSTWGSRLEAVGLWYDQLLSESLGKHERGATPLTVVNTRDLHSRGQQHQEGRRDKLITNLLPGPPVLAPLTVAAHRLDQDRLNQLAGTTLPRILEAAISGTNQAYADAGRPTADLLLPGLSEHSLGQLFQMLMLATVVEGRLVGTNPYGQPGVEAYKKNMQANLGIQ